MLSSLNANPVALSTGLRPPTLRHRFEYVVLRLVVWVFAALPRTVARWAGALVGRLVYNTLPRLRRTGLQNLALAYPEKSAADHHAILRGVFRSLGWQLAEFCQMPGYTALRAGTFIRYEGLNEYLAAKNAGKGVLVLTGHLGAWELSSFYHSLVGYPMSLVIRRLDNPLVDGFVNRVRCLHGNKVIHKDDFARGLLTAMHRGETVGVLMDTNMTPPQGVFVPFFGVSACTATAVARVALRTGAAVLPGFLVWENATAEHPAGYVLHFGETLAMIRSGNTEADIVANTALFTATLESWIRRYPDQWLWVHRRWKTRPSGEPKIYA